MSISHNGYAFGSPIHGTVQHGAFEFPLVNQQFFGLIGEVHLIGQRSGRQLSLSITLQDQASLSAVHALITQIAEKVGQTGTLVVDGGSWPSCTFLGFVPEEPPWRDGTGLRGWICRGTLTWRQVAT